MRSRHTAALAAALLLLAAAPAPCAGSPEQESVLDMLSPLPASSGGATSVVGDAGAGGTGVDAGLPAQTASLPEENGRGVYRSELVMRALSAAYPRVLSLPAYRDGDWAVQVRGQWFYYADGRLLPEELREDAASYDAQSFYKYPEELPAWQAPDSETQERLKSAVKARRARPSRRSQHFFDALWNARSRQEAWDQVKTLKFLGREVLVHHAILEPLAMVEQRLLALAQSDSKVRRWVDSLTSISAWNWRNIADTGTRSNHAYGTAIDCLMPSQRGMETYWLWTAQKNAAWWSVPYTSRLSPPASVIQVFESYGFVWGGKWQFYDTMHFEYRPEIFILNNIPLTGEY